MALSRAVPLRPSLRAISARPVTSQPFRLTGFRNASTEKPTSTGSSGMSSTSMIIAAGGLGVASIFFFLLGTPEKVAGVAHKVDPASAEIQRRGPENEKLSRAK